MLKVIWFMRQVNRLFGFGAVRGFGYSGLGGSEIRLFGVWVDEPDEV